MTNLCRFETVEKLNGSNGRSFYFLQIDCFFNENAAKIEICTFTIESELFLYLTQTVGHLSFG